VCLVPYFIRKKFRFWSIILQNGTKHHAKFLAKRYPFSIFDFGLKRQKKKAKKPKSSHPPHEKFSILDGTKHTMKILAFCISSFQSSWHFAFHGELNTTLVILLKFLSRAGNWAAHALAHWVNTFRPARCT
jgi:hypothetical protein